MKPRFSGHTAPICRITLSADHIHTTSNDKTLRVWSKENGECLRILETFKYIPYHTADDRYLHVIAWADLFVFNAHSWDRIAQLHLPTSQDLQGVAQDADRLYIPSRDGKLFVIDKTTLKLEQELEIGGSAWAIACGGGHLYLSALDGSIAVWDKALLNPIGRLTGHKANVQRLEVDDRYLYSLSADRDLIVWSQDTGDVIKRLPKVFRRSMIGLRPGDRFVYLANAGEGLKVLDKGTWAFVATRPDLRVPYGKAMAVDDEYLYLGLNDFSLNAYPKGDLVSH